MMTPLFAILLLIGLLGLIGWVWSFIGKRG